MLDFDSGYDLGQICRDDNCDLDCLHFRHEVPPSIAIRPPRRKSKGWREPWKATCSQALQEATYRAISSYEPRNFSTVLSFIENDYGTCCVRSVHRHLNKLRWAGRIERMDFSSLRIHAYLRTGSRMLRDPDLVLEQILVLHHGEATL